VVFLYEVINAIIISQTAKGHIRNPLDNASNFAYTYSILLRIEALYKKAVHFSVFSGFK